MATLTFEVSDSLLTRARETAQALNRPLEEILIGALAVGLPDVQDVPASVRSELLEMTFLDEESLWQIAKDEMASAEQRELQALLDVQQRPLVPQEQVRLQELRESYGIAMLRKARAFALLSLRSGQPLLAALEETDQPREMASVSASLRNQVARRAHFRCEYCLTSRKISGAQMHVEHIWPRSKGGTLSLDILCYACAWCNSFKGTQTHAIDPNTQEEVRLFHPRNDEWSSNFAQGESGLRIVGTSPIGNATVEALHMNNEYVLPDRRHWILAGWHPPETD